MADLKASILYKPNPPLELGEGPIFRAEDSTLHFNDITSKQVHILPIDTATGDIDGSRQKVTHNTADHISCQYFRQNHPGYICLYWQGIGLLDEQTGQLQVLKELISDRKRGRMNDGAVDPMGRLWAGELDFETAAGGTGFTHEPSGRLWRYDPDGSVHLIIERGLAISNGIGFSPDHKRMYLNDSLGQVTYAFEYDNESGNISNRQILHDFKNTTVEPDGLVVDTDGNIWTALYNGSAVICMNPSGEIIRQAELPAKSVTCPTWGGASNDILYVTTAKGNAEDGGGGIYKIKTDSRGMPKYKFAG